jgi:hypothetical protein
MTEVDEDLKAAELEALKEQATKLGIKFHPAIGEDKLREKVKEAMNKVDDEGTADANSSQETATTEDTAPRKETQAEFALRKKQEAMALVRVRITCMNPNKREWEGELFTAANSLVGTVRRMVPFNTIWHVENILYKQIKNRKCQIFVDAKTPDGKKKRVSKLVPEFAIEVLPALTESELKELAQRQAMAKGTADSL